MNLNAEFQSFLHGEAKQQNDGKDSTPWNTTLSDIYYSL